MKVLIVDDDPRAIAVARARLEKDGLTVVSADGGEAGLAAAKRDKPDLILLDVNMPDLSGFEVCGLLKDDDSDLRDVPVVFLTAADDSGEKAKGLDLGAVDYVTKPFDAFELRARVRAALRTKRFQDLLIEHAQIDPLTGLPNRRALMKRLHQEWSRAVRYHRLLSLIMVDIDLFKSINDTYGHAVGDRFLQEAAKAISDQCREADLAGRYGGEEFAVVVPEETSHDAGELAERCRLAVADVRLKTAAGTVKGTASFGVADSTGVGSADELIELADEALYKAKDLGRDAVALHSVIRQKPICLGE